MSRSQDKYTLKVKENYSVIDEVDGRSISECVYKVADKHYGGLGEMIARDFAEEWKETFGPEAFKNMLEPQQIEKIGE